MFRITRDPSSGSFIQFLAKITVMVLSCPLTWTLSVLYHVNGHDRTITVIILAKHCIKHGSTVVNVLCYKSKGRWFDPSLCQWIFR